MRHTKEDKFLANETLFKILDKRKEIYCSVKHVANSGMSRHIAFYVADGDKILTITRQIGVILDLPYRERTGGLFISGCGMDMGFHIVYNLGLVMFEDGYRFRNVFI